MAYSVKTIPKAPTGALFGKLGVMAGPQIRDTRPALTKSEMYRPGLGLGLGMDAVIQNKTKGYLV